MVPPQTPDRDLLSQIEAEISALPSLLAKLACLAQLRDPNTGVYSYPTVTDRSRTQEAHRVLERLHTQSFRRWLKLNLAGQKADLDLYLSGLPCSRPTVVRTWIQIESYRCFVPASASPPERELFVSDMETLLRLEGATEYRDSSQLRRAKGRTVDRDVLTLDLPQHDFVGQSFAVKGRRHIQYESFGFRACGRSPEATGARGGNRPQFGARHMAQRIMPAASWANSFQMASINSVGR